MQFISNLGWLCHGVESAALSEKSCKVFWNVLLGLLSCSSERNNEYGN